jgi:hypothetical protein
VESEITIKAQPTWKAEARGARGFETSLGSVEIAHQQNKKFESMFYFEF